jgi:late competence protein required for DNA uptake (superfamily II DNA/RNA helicase)
VTKKYDLAILDDVSNYSYLDNYDLKGTYEYTLEISKRSILYAIEPVIPIGEKIQLTNIFKEVPFIEPRIITTRIDLNKDIPYILYDYLKWFRDEKKRVIIFVPDRDKLDIVYDYIS